MKSNSISNDSSKAVVALFVVFLAIVLSEFVAGTLSFAWISLMAGIVAGFALVFGAPFVRKINAASRNENKTREQKQIDMNLDFKNDQYYEN